LLEPTTNTAKIPLLDAEVSGSFAPLHQLAAQLYAARQDRQRAAEQARRAQILRMVDAQWKASQRRPAP
jgi:outer membrane murein-binding lipoprotein Lpp